MFVKVYKDNVDNFMEISVYYDYDKKSDTYLGKDYVFDADGISSHNLRMTTRDMNFTSEYGDSKFFFSDDVDNLIDLLDTVVELGE